ncbi:MAG: M48 family metalloprotease [Rickettsiales bacterium]|nr:M48 family metalloprotease [Rickettsiales bacterium]
MFSKPINLILVFLITVFNIVILLTPFLAMLLPFMNFEGNVLIVSDTIYQKAKYLVFLSIFMVSFFMLIYLFLDFLFGFSVRASLKNCVRYEKLKDYDFLSNIFDQIKTKFNEKSVNLYIKNSDEINAYAVSSVGSKAIVLTRGLINHFLVECDDSKKLLYALRAIMGHEMSHLANKDFLPTFLIIANQKATNLTSKILRIIFNFISRTMVFISRDSRAVSGFMVDIYFITNFFLTSFNRFVVFNVYEFLRRFISRSVEYRCDVQSAQAFGGSSMAFALSMLGEGGYFTLFSTHPKTIKRIKKVEKIKAKDSVITPRFFDSLANYFSIMFLMVICLFFAKEAGVDLFVKEYLQNHEVLSQKLSSLWGLVNKIF